MVGNPEDLFSHDEAHIKYMKRCITKSKTLHVTQQRRTRATLNQRNAFRSSYGKSMTRSKVPVKTKDSNTHKHCRTETNCSNDIPVGETK